MEEKDEYGKYAVELPYQNKRFKLPTGVVESEELWLKLRRFFRQSIHLFIFRNIKSKS